jgi:ATP-dependent exoDNAse (exonuclease V) beta subunit
LCRKYVQTEKIKWDFPVRRLSVSDIEESLPKVKEEQVEVLEKRPLDDEIERLDLAAEFGTLCHLVLEKKIQGSFRQEDVPYGLKESIGESRFDLFLRESELLAGKFLQSSLARKMRTANSVETEVPFVFLKEEHGEGVFINGRIDLIFCIGEEVFVVDFKTDRIIKPGQHMFQIDLYTRAAEELTGKKGRGFVFYLRNGGVREHEVKV